MAQDNLEDILKRKLDARRIEPGENAWERISARPRPSKKRTPLLYWIPAACITLLAGWFWMNREDVVTDVRIVNAPSATKQTDIPEKVAHPTGKISRPAASASRTEVAVAMPHDSVPQIENHIAVVAPAETPNAVEERKINEIVTELGQLQQDGQAITEATVDSLLAKAQRELALEKEQRRATDPDKLLAESENELDMSFKDRVFAAINKFKKVRIAVGNQ